MLSTIPHSQKIMVMIGVMLALLLAALDQTIVATAMPRIVQEFNELEHLSWVFISYMLCSTIIVPIYGKLSDIYGRKYFILSAIVIFLVGSMLSGVAQSMTQLILFRGIQGFGGGGIFANAFAIIGDLFPPRERGRWQGLFGGVFGVASVIGPTLGGWLTDHASWRWTFYINIPVGILALGFVWFLMPRIVPAVKNRSIDYLGSFFLAFGLVTLLLGLVWGGTQFPWLSWQIISLFSVSIVSFILFALTEMRVVEPVLPLTLFKNPIFSVSSLIIFLMGIGMFGAILYVPLFAQLVLGISATNSGTILTPLTLGMVIASIGTGQFVSRTGKYKTLAIAGIGIATLGLFLLSQMSADTAQLDLIARMVVTGFGLGITLPIFTLAVQNAFDHAQLGVATASTQLFRSIGGTVGTAVLGGVLNSSLSEKFVHLSSDPFMHMMAKMNPQFHASSVDINQVQAFLTGEGRTMLETQIANLPPEIAPSVAGQFAFFLQKIKMEFASSVGEVFFIASLLMGIAFIATFFLKEIPLRQSHEKRSDLEKAGVKIGLEEGEIFSKDVPHV